MKAAPIWDFVQAAGAMVIFLFVSSYSILSTENMIQGGDGSGVRPSFDVITQLIGLWKGEYSGVGAIAIMISFFLWFCYMGFAFYFEHYRAHLNSQSKGTGEAFITLVGILIAVDSFANWNSLSRNPWPWYWQLVVTVGIAGVLMYLGHFSFFHFEKGWKGLSTKGSVHP